MTKIDPYTKLYDWLETTYALHCRKCKRNGEIMNIGGEYEACESFYDMGWDEFNNLKSNTEFINCSLYPKVQAYLNDLTIVSDTDFNYLHNAFRCYYSNVGYFQNDIENRTSTLNDTLLKLSILISDFYYNRHLLKK